MSRTGHILAVVAVATVLCADQAAVAAPLARPQVAEIAARLVDRLSQPFRRSVPNAIRVAVRHQPSQTDLADFPDHPINAVVLHCDLSPFQFRLPPPNC